MNIINFTLPVTQKFKKQYDKSVFHVYSLTSPPYDPPKKNKALPQHYPYFLLKRTGIQKQNICTGTSFPKALLAPLPQITYFLQAHIHKQEFFPYFPPTHKAIPYSLRKHIYSTKKDFDQRHPGNISASTNILYISSYLTFVLKSKYIDLATSTYDSLGTDTLHPICDSPEDYLWRQCIRPLAPLHLIPLAPLQTPPLGTSNCRRQSVGGVCCKVQGWGIYYLSSLSLERPIFHLIHVANF